MSTQASLGGAFRNQFMPTPIATQQSQDEVAKQHLYGNSNGYTDILKIESGINIFRLYPAHPDTDGSYSQILKQVYLPIMKEDRGPDKKVMIDPKTGHPIMKEGMKSVFDSRLHARTQKDLVDEYCKFAAVMAKELFPGDDNKQKQYLMPITGSPFQPGGKQEFKGIQYQVSYIAYAEKILPGDKREFGRLQYKNAVRKRFLDLSFIESTSSPLGYDPFSGPDDGRAVCVTFDRSQLPADMYKVDFYAPMIPGTNGQIQLFPISDESLEAFMKLKSLHELYVGSYKRSDFEIALDGLSYFDNKYGYKIFEEPAFMTIVEELNQYYPQENPAENNMSARSAKSDTDLPFGQGAQPAPQASGIDFAARTANKQVAMTQPASIQAAPAPTYLAPPLPAEMPGTDPFVASLHADPAPQVQQVPVVTGTDRMAAMKAKLAAAKS